MGNLEHALSAYENALRHNSHSLPGLTQVAGIARIKENYPKVSVRSNLARRPSRTPSYVIVHSHRPMYLRLRLTRALTTLVLPQAVEYFQAALQVQGDNGEVWSALGTPRHISFPLRPLLTPTQAIVT